MSKAAAYNHVECVKLLLEHRADPNCVDLWLETPLFKTSVKGNIECMRLLLAGKPWLLRIRCSFLHLLIRLRSDFEQVVQMYIKRMSSASRHYTQLLWAAGQNVCSCCLNTQPIRRLWTEKEGTQCT